MSTVSLRPMTEQDAPRLFSLVDTNRDTLHKFWWEEKTQSPDDSLAYIMRANETEVTDRIPTRGIFAQELLIGVAGLHSVDWRKRRAEVGYWIDTDHTGQGYVQEAVRQLAGVAFGEVGLNELTICTRVSNQASRSVAERCGFRLTAIDTQPSWDEDAPVDVAHYSLFAKQSEISASD